MSGSHNHGGGAGGSARHEQLPPAPSASPLDCSRLMPSSSSRSIAAYAQQAVRGVLHVLCTLLPFPLVADPALVWKRAAGSNTSVPTAPPSVRLGGSSGFAPDRMVKNTDFGALTRGAVSLEDAIGASFEASALCVLIAHSELSADSIRLIRELHDLVDTHQNESLHNQQVDRDEGNSDGSDERVTPARRSGKSSAAVHVGSLNHGHAWQLLSSTVHTYVISLFSLEGSFIPALQTCTAPAVLVYAPINNQTRVGAIMGPVVLQDVVTLVEECQTRWASPSIDSQA